ncbi:MAG: hypothetical protein GY854_03215 [Deltaproteobacteria bacterium]|nr:hypothetical protein [Deltaproteobacteria bacterium]
MMENSSVINKVAKNIRVRNGLCPNGHSLMSEDKLIDGEAAIAVHVRLGGRSGVIYLNPYYGRFEYESEVPLSGEDVVELSCPECGVSLAVDTLCKLCDIPMFAIQLPDGGQVEACPKVGCHNHALKIVNLDEQLARMYVDETKVQM